MNKKNMISCECHIRECRKQVHDSYKIKKRVTSRGEYAEMNWNWRYLFWLSSDSICFILNLLSYQSYGKNELRYYKSRMHRSMKNLQKSVNFLCGICPNSAYSCPPSVFCNCNTKGLLVTIPEKAMNDWFSIWVKRKNKNEVKMERLVNLIL